MEGPGNHGVGMTRSVCPPSASAPVKGWAPGKSAEWADTFHLETPTIRCLGKLLAQLLLGIWTPMAPNRFLLATGKLRKQSHLTLRSGGFILAMLLSACVSRAHRIYLAACQESHTNNGGRMTSSSKLKCSQCVLTVCNYVYLMSIMF